jgi:hypothetical protein
MLEKGRKMADEEERKTRDLSRARDSDSSTLGGAISIPRIPEDVDELASAESAPEGVSDSSPESAPDAAQAAETMVFVDETLAARPDSTDHAPLREDVTVAAVARAAAPAGPASATSTGSVPAVLPSASSEVMLLERIEPSLWRGERFHLDPRQMKFSLGRAEFNDIRLYTAGASREHASIAANQAGEWIASPAPGRSILIDGSPTTTPVVLETGMNLVLGGDHLRCVTESVDRSEAVAPTVAEAPKLLDSSARRIGIIWWAIGLATLLGVGLIVSDYWFEG